MATTIEVDAEAVAMAAAAEEAGMVVVEVAEDEEETTPTTRPTARIAIIGMLMKLIQTTA